MVYNALIEQRFSESAAKARENIQQKQYDSAILAIKDAAQIIEGLLPPTNLAEKVEYLELRAKEYQTLLQLYGMLSGAENFMGSAERASARKTIRGLAEIFEEEITLNDDGDTKQIVDSLERVAKTAESQRQQMSIHLKTLAERLGIKDSLPEKPFYEDISGVIQQCGEEMDEYDGKIEKKAVAEAAGHAVEMAKALGLQILPKQIEDAAGLGSVLEECTRHAREIASV